MSLPVPAPQSLPSPVIDSHCHLDIITDFSGLTPREVLVAATTVGVSGVVQVGVDLGSSRHSVAYAHEFSNVVAAVGVHPNEAPVRAETGHLDTDLATLADLTADPLVVAVGETGMDHYRTDETGRAAQEVSFREHIRMAKATGKALIIHDRDAHDDVLRVLADEDLPDNVIFHCFSGDAGMAADCSAAGWYLSFAGVMTFKNAQDLRNALAVVPLERILVETDAPFLTPTPHRGRPNAPYLLPWTVRAMAHERSLELSAMCEQLYANTVRAFGLDGSFG
jgi:TatD DNase family protein